MAYKEEDGTTVLSEGTGKEDKQSAAVCELTPVIVPVNPIGSYSSILASLNEGIAAELGEDKQCDLSCGFLPSPVWPGVKAPSWELQNLVSNVQVEGIKVMFGSAIEAVKGIGISLPPFPEAPGLGISFDDMFPIDWGSLVENADEGALKAATSSILPNPIYGSILSSSMATVDYIQAALNNYMVIMGTWFMIPITAVTDYVKSLDSDDKLGGLPSITIPSMPSLSSLGSLDAVNAIQIPFSPLPPFSLGMPSQAPILSTEYDFAQSCKNFTSGFAAKVLELILDFWEQLKGWADPVLALPDLVPMPFEIPVPLIIGKEQ